MVLAITYCNINDCNYKQKLIVQTENGKSFMIFRFDVQYIRNFRHAPLGYLKFRFFISKQKAGWKLHTWMQWSVCFKNSKKIRFSAVLLKLPDYQKFAPGFYIPIILQSASFSHIFIVVCPTPVITAICAIIAPTLRASITPWRFSSLYFLIISCFLSILLNDLTKYIR